MYEMGKTEDKPDAKGLALLMHPKIKDCVTDFKTYSNRAIGMTLYLRGKDSITVITACAPTSSAEDEKMEQLYDDTEIPLADIDSEYKTGDFGAKTEVKQKKKTSKTWGHLESGRETKEGIA